MRIASTLVLVTALSCSARADGQSTASKIGIHLIARYTDGAKKIVAANCPIIKLLDTTPKMLEALRDYKTKHPSGIVVLRIYTPTRYGAEADPKSSARDYWEKWLYPSLKNLTPTQKKLIDYLEGPNEGDNTPHWANVHDAAWFAEFWVELAAIMSANGFKPCVGSIPVGSPPGPPDEVEAKITAFIPALRAAKRLGGAWSYHAYTLKYTKDPKIEHFYSLRYRWLHDTVTRTAPELLDLPLLLTEGGVDGEHGYPPTPGWKRETAGKFEDWLKWFDSEIKRDAYVKGVTLFEIGHPENWDSFDLEPIAGWLADYLGPTPPR